MKKQESKAAGVPLSVRRIKRQYVWAKSGGLCWYCGAQLYSRAEADTEIKKEFIFTADHLHPRKYGGRGRPQDDTLLSFVSAIDAVFALDERAPTRLLAPESRGLAWTSSREESGSQTMPSLSNRELIDKGRIASESPPRITSLETRSCGLLVAGQDLRLALPKAYGPLLCSNEFANELRR